MLASVLVLTGSGTAFAGDLGGGSDGSDGGHHRHHHRGGDDGDDDKAESTVASRPGFAAFNFTGGPQSFGVPAGVLMVTADLYGAAGGSSGGGQAAGGGGAHVRATIPLPVRL
ncbi:MAG: hypothetical protein ACRD0H_07740 [Actinomycetes bacterium]